MLNNRTFCLQYSYGNRRTGRAALRRLSRAIWGVVNRSDSWYNQNWRMSGNDPIAPIYSAYNQRLGPE